MDAGGRRRRRHTAGIGAAWRRTASSCRGAADNGKKGGKQRGALRDLACTHRPGALGGLDDAARRVNVTHPWAGRLRSEEHTSELQSLMRISYAVFCLTKK